MPEGVKPKILIFVSKTGGGHISLGEALRDRLEDRYTIEMIDPQPGIIHFHYRVVSRHALWLWAAEFRFSDTPARSRAAHRVFTALLVRNVASALKAAQPDLVISTYPFLTFEVTQAMKRLGRRVPFVMQLADPNGVHQSWLTERGAETVFAPTRETHQQALEAGFDPQKVHMTGWPVRKQFYRILSASREEKLAQLGLDPKRFTIFLQGGGEGAARFISTIENVLAVPELQIILATGTNQGLYERYKGTPRLFAQPFNREIAPIMAAADVVMGKAGPNMLFEAVTLGKPFIATAYIPGQEQANLEFIPRHKLGWVALDKQSQRELASNILQHPNVLEDMKKSVEAYRQWNTEATESIAPLIDRLLQKKVKG